MNGLGDFFGGANSISGGALGLFLLAFVFLMGYVASKRVSPSDEVGVGTGLVTAAFFGGLFWFAGWITWYYAFIPVVLIVIMIIYRSINTGGI